MDTSSNPEELIEQLLREWQNHWEDALKNPEGLSQCMEKMYAMQCHYFDYVMNHADSKEKYAASQSTSRDTAQDSSLPDPSYEQLSYVQCIERIIRLEQRVQQLESNSIRAKEAVE